MNITLVTTGTWGDVQPFLALALGLQERGHDVVLAAPVNFSSQIASYGVPYTPLAGDTQAILASEQGRSWMAAGETEGFMNGLNRLLRDIRHELRRDLLQASRNSDALIFHPLLVFEACILSEAQSKPFMFLTPYPMMPATASFPQLYIRSKPLPLGFLNKLTYRIFAGMHERARGEDVCEWRSELGLGSATGDYYHRLEQLEVPIVHAYSPNLVLPPKEWGDHHIITGALRQPEGGGQASGLSDELETWLSQGPAPIYVGFEGLPLKDVGWMLNLVLRVIERLGSRAIVAAQWSRMGFADLLLFPSIFRVETVEHRLLFPCCCCAVHHGGAEMTHKAAVAGLPSIICSSYAEQAFWGERIVELGIGSHLPFSEMTEDRLSEAIKFALQERVADKARELSERMECEGGLHKAIEAVELHLPAAPIYHAVYDEDSEDGVA